MKRKYQKKVIEKFINYVSYKDNCNEKLKEFKEKYLSEEDEEITEKRFITTNVCMD